MTLVLQREGGRSLRVGLAVPLLGTAAELREMVAREGDVPPQQVKGRHSEPVCCAVPGAEPCWALYNAACRAGPCCVPCTALCAMLCAVSCICTVCHLLCCALPRATLCHVLRAMFCAICSTMSCAICAMCCALCHAVHQVLCHVPRGVLHHVLCAMYLHCVPCATSRAMCHMPQVILAEVSPQGFLRSLDDAEELSTAGQEAPLYALQAPPEAPAGTGHCVGLVALVASYW